MVKNPPVMRETWVRSLGQEDTLEKGMAIHSGILAWIIPWTEQPGGLQPMGSQEADTTQQGNHHHHQSCTEGRGGAGLRRWLSSDGDSLPSVFLSPWSLRTDD